MAGKTLDERAALENKTLNKAVMRLFTKTSTVFDRLPLKDISGNAYAYNLVTALPGTAFRAVGEAYTPDTGVINQKVETLAIVGGDSDTDTFDHATTTESIGNLRAERLAMKIESLQANFVDTFFNGDTTANAKAFDGLRARLVGSQVLTSEAPATVAAGAAFLDELDALYAAVGGSPDIVYAPEAVLTRLRGIFRREGAYAEVVNQINGKREVIWNGVPIVSPGKKADETPILAVDAAAGGDLYAVKWSRSEAQEGILGITNGGVNARDLGEVQDKPAYRHRVEFFCGVTAQGKRAAARLSGVKLA